MGFSSKYQSVSVALPDGLVESVWAEPSADGVVAASDLIWGCRDKFGPGRLEPHKAATANEPVWRWLPDPEVITLVPVAVDDGVQTVWIENVETGSLLDRLRGECRFLFGWGRLVPNNAEGHDSPAWRWVDSDGEPGDDGDDNDGSGSPIPFKPSGTSLGATRLNTLST